MAYHVRSLHVPLIVLLMYNNHLSQNLILKLYVDTERFFGLVSDNGLLFDNFAANKASDIPPPLLDRLEVITLSGYTMEEKGHIAAAHLLPQLLTDHGLLPGRVLFPSDVVLHVIDRYAVVPYLRLSRFF